MYIGSREPSLLIKLEAHPSVLESTIQSFHGTVLSNMGSQAPKKLTITINPKYLIFITLSFLISLGGSTLLVFLLEGEITVNCAPDLPRNNYSFPGMIQEFNGNKTPGHVVNPVTSYFG